MQIPDMYLLYSQILKDHRNTMLTLMGTERYIAISTPVSYRIAPGSVVVIYGVSTVIGGISYVSLREDRRFSGKDDVSVVIISPWQAGFAPQVYSQGPSVTEAIISDITLSCLCKMQQMLEVLHHSSPKEVCVGGGGGRGGGGGIVSLFTIWQMIKVTCMYKRPYY